MEANLDNALTDVVRRWARETTPQEMHARGVRKVRSVSLSRVAGLIEKAINRALIERTLGSVGEDHEAFSNAAREEFVRLIQGGGPQAAPPEAGSALDQLKSQLRNRRQNQAQNQELLSEKRGIKGPEDETLQSALKGVFTSWGGDAQRLSPLEQEIVKVAVGALRQERRRGQQSELNRQKKETELLARRVAKLNKELKNTEAELARVLATKAVDSGVGSKYAEVQGLAQADGQFERKSELMTALFAANIELRVKLDSQTGNPAKTEEPQVELIPVARREGALQPADDPFAAENLPSTELPKRGVQRGGSAPSWF
ncbi:MAG: hypothetical protein JKY61_11965 [Planctomycetes bacterium]|nr:hypothetical protein [Planctomycetota bacterium]